MRTPRAKGDADTEEAAVRAEVGRLVAEALGKAQDTLQRAMNEMAVLSASYSWGTLPKQKEPEQAKVNPENLTTS